MCFLDSIECLIRYMYATYRATLYYLCTAAAIVQSNMHPPILEWSGSLQLCHMMTRVALLNMRTSTFTCFVPLHISHNSSAA